MKISIYFIILFILLCLTQCTLDASSTNQKGNSKNTTKNTAHDDKQVQSLNQGVKILSSYPWKYTINKLKYLATPDSLRYRKNILCFQAEKVVILCLDSHLKRFSRRRFFEPTEFLDDKEYNQLTIKEKLYYAANYPESTTQICNGWLKPEDYKISFKFDMGYYSTYPSDRQASIFQEDSTIVYLRQCLRDNQNLNTSFKVFLGEVSYKIIPDLIAYYEQTTDKEILTTLLSILPYNYKPLEGLLPMSFEDFSMDLNLHPYIIDTPSNRKQLLEIAQNYYDNQVALEEQNL